jgi:hypothetical protein
MRRRTDMTIDRRYRAPALVAGVLALFVASVQADPPPAGYCEVAIDFTLDGKHIAAPSAIVAFGEEAEVTIGNPDEHAWRFRILADAPAVVHRVNVIPVGIALDEIAQGTAYPKASPELKAVPGQRADIETIFGDGDGRHAHLTVVANPRSEAEVQAMRGGSGE